MLKQIVVRTLTFSTRGRDFEDVLSRAAYMESFVFAKGPAEKALDDPPLFRRELTCFMNCLHKSALSSKVSKLLS